MQFGAARFSFLLKRKSFIISSFSTSFLSFFLFLRRRCHPGIPRPAYFPPPGAPVRVSPSFSSSVSSRRQRRQAPPPARRRRRPRPYCPVRPRHPFFFASASSRRRRPRQYRPMRPPGPFSSSSPSSLRRRPRHHCPVRPRGPFFSSSPPRRQGPHRRRRRPPFCSCLSLTSVPRATPSRSPRCGRRTRGHAFPPSAGPVSPPSAGLSSPPAWLPSFGTVCSFCRCRRPRLLPCARPRNRRNSSFFYDRRRRTWLSLR
mmetsp:Transcript_36061/g.70960  ORF Transcript_36061/g.70960 Transcript_36061/m.70960 type:complete len:258 (-) Transcript_36061:251-1024(-)